jgi:hypothetical protein
MRDGSAMGGNLDLEQLKQEVARRAVDVCFTDMQGRLIGKRVLARIPVCSPEEDLAPEDLHKGSERRRGRTAWA